MPLHTATTFERDPDNQYRRGRSYARAGSAAYDQPQAAVITALEGGAATLVFASGMAAATTVFRILPLGAHVVASLLMYHSLRHWIAWPARPDRSLMIQHVNVRYLASQFP